MRHPAALSLWLVLLAASAWALADPVKIEDLAGEILSFRVYWLGIPAAEAQLSVERPAPDRLRFVSRAQGLPAVRFFYPLDSRLDSEVLLPGPRPLSYRKSGREGWGKEQEREARFDSAAGESRYYKNGALSRTLKVPGDVQDPLSCFFFYRTRPVEDNESVTLRVCDGKRLVEGTVAVLRRETVTVPAGTFATVVVQPRMEGIGGVFAKSPNAVTLVWLTDDARRIPVKLKSEVSVGSFTALLERIGPPSLSPLAPPPGQEAHAAAEP